jgi:hypothetical protein
MNKVVMAMAHPDDELIFGWPILFDESIEKHLVIFSSDAFNTDRTWCKHRKEATYKICKKLGISVSIFDLNSEFYRMGTRNKELFDNLNTIFASILSLKYDWIFTHNSFGEYGHLDHILVHTLAKRLNMNLITTDICLETNWLPRFNDDVCENYQSKTLCTLNEELYEECKKEYEKVDSWTWNQPPITSCNLVRL